MSKKWCLLWLNLFWVCHLSAGEYTVVLVSGDAYQCQEKYVVDDNQMVRFTLVSGAEIAVPESKIAWYETAIANGEKPPPNAKPIERQGDQKTPTLRETLPKISFQLSALRSDFSSLLKQGFSWNLLASWNALTWIAAIILLIVTHFLASFLLWYLMSLFGEPNVYFKVVGVNALLFLASAIVFILTGHSPIEPIHTVLIALFLNLFICASIVIMVFDCEIGAGVLLMIVYQIVVGFSLYGLWKTLRFWIG